MPIENDPLTSAIIGAAIEVHRVLGPGLIESVYERCLAWELGVRELRTAEHQACRVVYKGLELEGALRCDLVVEDRVLVEVKAVPQIEPIHEAQILTYMRLRRAPVGLLLNFWVPVLKNGIRRYAM